MLILLLKLAVDVCWYLSIIGPFLLRFPAPLTWLACLAPIVYVALQLYHRQVYSHGANVDTFLLEGKTLVVGALVGFALAGPDSWARMSGVWTFLFMSLGVLLMRVSRLRENYQKDRRFWMWNVAYLTAICLTAVVLTSETFLGAVLWVVKLVYFHMVMPILLALISALGWVINVILQTMAKLFPDRVASVQKLFELQMIGEGNGYEKVDGLQEAPAELKTILMVVVIVIFLAALWLIYKKLTSMGSKRVQSGDMTKTWLVNEKKDSPRERILQKEEKSVRAFYHKFLRLCLRAELPITPTQSSEEIQEMAASLWQEEELSPLRAVYIRARYSGKDVRKEDVEKAKEEYRKLKKQFQGKI